MNPHSIDFTRPLPPEMIADLAYLTVSEGLGDYAPQFETWWSKASAADRELYKNELDSAATLILALAEPQKVPKLKPELIVAAEPHDEIALPLGFSHLRADEGEWRDLPVPGARVKELSTAEQDGFVTMLLELDAGTRFPAHEHHGAEHVYLLDGDLITDGRKMAAGDFLRACADTHHSGLYSEQGCHALIITAKPNYPQKSVRLYDWVSKNVRNGIKFLVEK